MTSIGDYAFGNCASFTSLTIPEGVTSIGRSAFSYCTGLTSVTIPSSVTSIGSSAFYACTGLTSITIPLSLTSISQETFAFCTGLTSITIPSSVTSIGNYAFYGCTGLTSVTSLIRDPFEIEIGAFQYQNLSTKKFTSATLYVPKGTKEKYKATAGWKEFEKIEEIEVSVQPQGDVNGDQTIDVADIASVISVMAKSGNDAAADVNKDGVVDVADIASIISVMAANARELKIED